VVIRGPGDFPLDEDGFFPAPLGGLPDIFSARFSGVEGKLHFIQGLTGLGGQKEVGNAVGAGPGSGYDGSPVRGSYRRKGFQGFFENSLFHHPFEVGELAFFDKLLDEFGVTPVNSQYDGPFGLRGGLFHETSFMRRSRNEKEIPNLKFC
jgi:hypothetical protein